MALTFDSPVKVSKSLMTQGTVPVLYQFIIHRKSHVIQTPIPDPGQNLPKLRSSLRTSSPRNSRR